MSYAVYDNPVTGERGIPRVIPTAENGQRLVADLYAAPGSRVSAPHLHPYSRESFTVVRGQIRAMVDGVERTLSAGERVVVPPNTRHDWWNTADETSWVIVEVTPAGRFVEAIRTGFFLAADGKTDSRGRPNLLQAALMAREFDDVIRFASPPRPVQRVVFAALAPIARMRGYRGTYPEFEHRVSDYVEQLEVIPADVAALLSYRESDGMIVDR